MGDTYTVRRGRASQVIGRWHDTRLYSARGISAPYIFDRRTGHLTPHQRDEWVYDDVTAQWYAAVRGGAGWSSQLQHERLSLVQSILNLSAATHAIDVAYIYGSTGKAIAGRYKGPAKTLTSLYGYLTAKTITTGIPGNDLDYEIRDSSSSTKPGSNIQAGGSGTIDISGTTAPSWISASGLSVSLSADTEYWACLADASAVDTSNFATLARSSGFLVVARDFAGNDGVTTANGFSTVTADNRVMNIVWGFSDSTSIGDPFTGNTPGTSNTERRGIYFSTGFTEQIKFYAMYLNAAITNVSGLEIYDSSATVPGTGALSIGGVSTVLSAATVFGYYVNTPYTLAKATGYRVVFTFSGNSNSLNYYTIGTGADSVLAQAMLGGGGWYWARANGTTNWSNDITTAFPRCYIVLENQVAVAGSGGSKGDGTGMMRHVNRMG